MHGVAGEQQAAPLAAERLVGQSAHGEDGEPGEVERARRAEPAQHAQHRPGRRERAEQRVEERLAHAVPAHHELEPRVAVAGRDLVEPGGRVLGAGAQDGGKAVVEGVREDVRGAGPREAVLLEVQAPDHR